MKMTSTREECQDRAPQAVLTLALQQSRSPNNVIGLRAFSPVKHARASQGGSQRHTQKSNFPRFPELRDNKAVVHIQLQNLKLPSITIFASAYAPSTAESLTSRVSL